MRLNKKKNLSLSVCSAQSCNTTQTAHWILKHLRETQKQNHYTKLGYHVSINFVCKADNTIQVKITVCFNFRLFDKELLNAAGNSKPATN